MHVALHPKYVNSVPLGLVNHFNKLINQYHPDLKGILAGYGRLQLRRPTGCMINDEAHMHLDVQSDFWIFRPLVGRQLKGMHTYGTIPILRQQRDWVGGVRKSVIFADVGWVGHKKYKNVMT